METSRHRVTPRLTFPRGRACIVPTIRSPAKQDRKKLGVDSKDKLPRRALKPVQNLAQRLVELPLYPFQHERLGSNHLQGFPLNVELDLAPKPEFESIGTDPLS